MFHKLGSRAYLVISIVAVGVVVAVRDGRVVDARVSSARARRSRCGWPALEAAFAVRARRRGSRRS